MPLPEYQIKKFATPSDWEAWLRENHAIESGLWLQLAKKGSNEKTITHQEAIEVALCYGWIDGLANTLDETFWKIKFTPRRSKSMWSNRNKNIVAQLLKDKRMQASGLKEIEAAKADGRWDQAYDSPKDMKMPQDLLDELAKDPKALAFFNTLNKTNLYAIGWRLQTAKKPETRARRMKVLLEMLSKGEKLH